MTTGTHTANPTTPLPAIQHPHHKVQVALDVSRPVLAVLEVDLSHGHTRARIVGACGRHTLEALQCTGNVTRVDGCLTVRYHDGYLLTAALKLTHSLLQQLHTDTQRQMDQHNRVSTVN